MARRTRSFLFDNISKRLVQNTNKTAKEINTRRTANTTANTDILTKEEVQTVVSNTGINTLSDISVANVANEQVLQYNANTAKWENETLSLVSSVDGLTDTNLTSLSNGDYLVYSSSGSEWINRSLDLSSYVTDTDIADYSNTAQMNTAIAASNTAMKSYVDDQVANVDFSAYSTTTQMNTAIASSNTAMKNYVDAEVAGIVNSAPAALDTLNELAAALGDDANFSTTTSTALGNRLRIDVSNQSLTGTEKTNALTNLGITATVAELNYVDGVTSNIQTQLDAKGTSSFSGAYADLTGKPSLYANSDVDSHLNYNAATTASGQVLSWNGSDYAWISPFSGSYNDLSNKPTIPTNNNQLTNGAGYITNSGGTEAATASTVAKRNGSADINARLFRSNYSNQSTISGAIAYRVSTSDNYIRFCNDAAAIRSFIGAGTSSFSGSYTDLSNKPTIPTNNNQLTNGAGYITNNLSSNIDMNNYAITNLNDLSFNDPGPNEGIKWLGGSDWRIYESPDNLTTNSGGNLQFVTGTTRRMTLNTSGNLQTYSYQGHSNVDGTGNASYHPSGIYSRGTNWLYGSIITNNYSINAGTGSVTCGAITASGVIDANAGAGAINITNSDIRSSSTSTWTGNPGANGKIQYHSNRWYIVADSSSNRIVQFRRDNSDKSYIDNNGKFIGDISGSAGSVAWSNITSNIGVTTTYNSSLNGDSRNSRGVTRLYRRDNNSDYSVQTYWTGSYWRLYGYVGDSGHADTHVGYADSAGNAGTLDGVDSSQFLRSDTGDVISNSVRIEQRGYFDTGTSGQNNSITPSYGYGYQIAGGWTHPYPDIVFGYHTGMRFGGHTSYGGCRFYADHPSRTTSILFSIGNGDSHVRATNNLYAYTSDIRLKENFRPIENAIDKVKTLGGYIFDWREDMIKEHEFQPDQPKDDAGLIAQDVQKVMPAAIKRAPFDFDLTKPNQSKSGEEFLTVQYEKMVPLLIQAIKEQQEQIEKLEKIIEEKL